ncbi:MAG: transaldolase [Nitrospirae bacterium]|nr:transaldolase [Nitrospirota bacterium]
MVNNPLRELGELGQSVWLDNLSRKLITSGRLNQFIVEDGLRGITTNPTIFQKAISGSADYDGLIKGLLERGITNEKELFLSLAMRDVSDAADMLLPIYEETGGRDGYVSIEVSPDLAYAPDKTIQEAEYLYATIGRKNILVKVPATSVCIPAIEYLIGQGINVNVTLLFSVARYEEVAEAYIRGLEKRAGENQPINMIASVASFFVSRVDTLIDRLLMEGTMAETSNTRKEDFQRLMGRAAVANAITAYGRYQDIFSSKRFQSLQREGAATQRVLWASTGTKNPDYSDVKYAEELIAPDTVNTMPESLMEAFRNHGRPVTAIRGDIAGQPDPLITELRDAGIDIELIAAELENEGVKLFADSFSSVLSEVAKKRDILLSKQ